MSDQNTSEPSVASDVKEKDPKRVAAGKRLGAISKQRKEEKREALRLEQQAKVEVEYASYFVGGLAVAGAAYYLYLNKDKLITLTCGDEKKLPTIPEEPATPPPKRKSKRIFGE